jgi:VWFA-related protein
MGFGGWASVILFCASMPVAAQQWIASPPQDQAAPDRDHPTLSHRPAPAPGSIPEGKVKLDVVVTDDSGRLVAGLEQKDFTLLDSKKPRPILSFRVVDGVRGAGQADPPVQVILLIDAANTSLQRVAYTRLQVQNYLRQNGGHLLQPTSVLLFFDLGLKAWLKPSTDGNLLATQLEEGATAAHKIPLTKGYDEMELLSLSLRTLGSIAGDVGSTPGRKILIWIGPGWPLLDSHYYSAPASTRRQLFNAMIDLSQELRESRVTLHSIFPIDPALNDAREAEFYRSYLRGVASPALTEPGNLALPVFAIHSGGRALDTTGNLPMLINSCVQEATAYYTLTFDPAMAKRVDEYHELAVRVDKPQLRARTNTGYYAEPSFQFQLPALSLQH